MTAVLEDVRTLTEDELADLVSGEDDTARAAAVAELDRRDAEARRYAARHGQRRMADTAWAEAAHAQYVQADELCRGHLLSRKGKAAGITEWSLWTGPEHVARAYASPELNALWDDQGRITVQQWRDAMAADRREERETAALETAAANRTETRDMGAIYTGIRLTQAASRHPGGQGMTHEQYQQNPAVQKARARVQAQQAQRQAVTSMVQAAQARQAHQQVATRDPAETDKPLSGTVAAAPARQAPDAAQLLRMVLDEMGLLLSDYVEFPSKSAVIAVVLWIAQAVARDADHNPIWYAYPRLLLTSRQNGSGKSSVGDLARALLQCRAAGCPRSRRTG